MAVLAATSCFATFRSCYQTTPSFNTPFLTTEMNYSVVVTYSITITTHLTLSGGETGTVILESSEDGSTDWFEISRISSTQSGTLILGLAINDTKTMSLSGAIQPNFALRLRTVTSGSPTITLVEGQEYTGD